MPNTHVSVNAPGCPSHRLSIEAEFVELLNLRRSVDRRLSELTVAIERCEPPDVVTLPMSGLRLRATRPGSFLFEGGRNA